MLRNDHASIGECRGLLTWRLPFQVEDAKVIAKCGSKLGLNLLDIHNPPTRMLPTRVVQPDIGPAGMVLAELFEVPLVVKLAFSRPATLVALGRGRLGVQPRPSSHSCFGSSLVSDSCCELLR